MKTILVASILTLGAGLSAAAETPLKILKSKPLSETAPIQFEMDFKNIELEGRMRIDTSKEIGDRLELLSPNETSLSNDAQKKLEQLKKDTEGDIWCNDFAEDVPADATVLRETAESVTYGFQPAPSDDDDMAKVAEYLTGEITVRKEDPVVLGFSLRAPEPFKPVAVAKIKTFSMAVSCVPAPNGETHIQEMNFNINGSAMMRAFEEKEHRFVHNVTILSP